MSWSHVHVFSCLKKKLFLQRCTSENSLGQQLGWAIAVAAVMQCGSVWKFSAVPSAEPDEQCSNQTLVGCYV